VTDVDRAAVSAELGGSSWLVAPWSMEAAGTPPGDGSLGTGHAVCAVDVRGMFAALTYRRVMNGVGVEELELEAPPIAVPVLRGVTRVAPGAPIPAPAPIAMRVEGGVPVEIAAAPAAGVLNADTLSSARLRIHWEPSTRRATATKV
jgi:gamma-glutamyltranspeptidase/glutathione hydrolase